MNISAVVDRLSLILHAYWVELIDNAIQNPALQKRTKLSTLQLNLRNFKKIFRIID